MAFSTPIVHGIAVSSSPSSGATTASADTTGANLIVIVIAYSAGTTPGVADNKSNSWNVRTEWTGTGGGPYLQYYDCYAPTVGSGHTFSVSGTNVAAVIAFSAHSGSASSPHDQEIGATQVAVVSWGAGSITPTENDEIVFTAMGSDDAADPPSIDSGFTILDSVGFVGGQHYEMAMAYKIQTTAAATDPTWTGTATTPRYAASVTYKAAAAGGGGNWGPMLAEDLNRIVR